MGHLLGSTILGDDLEHLRLGLLFTQRVQASLELLGIQGTVGVGVKLLELVLDVRVLLD